MTERETVSTLWRAFNRIDEDFHGWEISSLHGQDLIFPLLLLHRLDCLLAPTKPEVLELKQDSSAGADFPVLLRRASGLGFFHTSPLSLAHVAEARRTELGSQLMAYLRGFSSNVRELSERLEVKRGVMRFARVVDPRPVMKSLTRVDLSRDAVPTEVMAKVLEELIQRVVTLPPRLQSPLLTPKALRKVVAELLSWEGPGAVGSA